MSLLLFQVVSQRFRQHQAEAVGSAIFLRFINPAISKILLRHAHAVIEFNFRVIGKIVKAGFHTLAVGSLGE